MTQYVCTSGGISVLTQMIVSENSGLILIDAKLQRPLAFLLKTLFTGVFAQSEKKGLSLFESFCR